MNLLGFLYTFIYIPVVYFDVSMYRDIYIYVIYIYTSKGVWLFNNIPFSHHTGVLKLLKGKLVYIFNFSVEMLCRKFTMTK